MNTVPPPQDTEEVPPPTDPAPTVRPPAESVAPWPEEQVTAVECPNPPGLSGSSASAVLAPCVVEQPGSSSGP